MGEVRTISEGGLEPANHRETAPVLLLLANHGQSAEPRPRASRAGALGLSCPRYGLLQSQLRPEAPPTTPPLLSRGTRGERGLAPFPLGDCFAPRFRGGVFCSGRGPRKTGTFGPPIVGFPRPRRPDVSLPCWCEASGMGWAGKFWLGASRLERPLRSTVPLGSPRLQMPLLRAGWRSRYFSHCSGSQTSEATPMGPDSSIPKG